MTNIDILGYVATVFVAVSFTFKNVMRIRIINGIGAVLFIIYGILIEKSPVYILNLIILIIQIYHISKIYKKPNSITD